MSTKPKDTPPAAQALQSDTALDFLDNFPRRLDALAGLLNAVAESGRESTQSVFIGATLHYLSELASDCAMEFTRWVPTHRQDVEGGAL